jgi:hypothetical protein
MARPENLRVVLLFAVAAIVYASFFFAKPINLCTADLGRHIVNGELILNGVSEVLFTNHYSFSEPQHEFTNHHWGSGVLFYALHELFGFKGLSIIYMLLNLVAVALVTATTARKTNWSVALLVSVFAVPLLAYRVEVRPEGFSYALIALFYLLLCRWKSEELSFKRLAPLLLIFQAIWVNLHIFFFFGIAVTGVFLVDALINNRTIIKKLTLLLIGQTLVSLINPHFLHGLLAPLTIFNEYGYMVAENQSLMFMQERFGNPEFYQFELFALLVILCIGPLIKWKLWKAHLAEIILIVSFGILSVIAVRGIALFSIFFIPFAAPIIYRFIEDLNHKTRKSVLKVLPIIGITFCIVFTLAKGTYASSRKGYEALGLIPDINLTGEFLRKQQIPGKIFNNYDIGGYMIYHLHDKEKVFVDNRPEAYSVAFFDSVYKPMQQDDEVWQRKSLEYGINTICFYRHDNTPWAQPFLIRRTQDPDWVPIFVDQACIVLIRNSADNQTWISRFALPRSMFQSVPN